MLCNVAPDTVCATYAVTGHAKYMQVRHGSGAQCTGLAAQHTEALFP